MRTLVFALALVICARSTSLAQRAADRDGDGILDNTDKCPDEPEDTDGFEDHDGCPDRDNDADGVLDINDLCPNDPEDKDGFQDADGCPDPDNDGDGIIDRNDKCPSVAENKNGFEDEDGCPDTGKVITDAPPPVPPTPKLKRPCADPRAVWSDERGACVSPNATKPAVVSVAPPAGAKAAPSGYRCGVGGTLVLNQDCECPVGRSARRDSDDVAICAKSVTTSPTTAPASVKSPVAAAMGKLIINARPTVTTGPSWAKIVLDGKPIGDTPVSATVPAGKHTVAYTRNDVTKVVSVTVTAGKTQALLLTIE